MQKIFFGYTRSFWLTFASIVTLLAGDNPATVGLIALVEPFLPVSREVALEWVQDVLPAFLFIVALVERSGFTSGGTGPRGYSVDPRDT